MKLRNKKTGEIADLAKRGLVKSDNDNHIIVYPDGTLKYYAYDSLAELNEEWEDYAPAEPLIKDEKIRKAVRAWAKVNDIRYIEPCARSNKDNYRIVGFNALGRSFTMELSNEYECRITMGQALSRKTRNAYTIDELCGEEEE